MTTIKPIAPEKGVFKSVAKHVAAADPDNASHLTVKTVGQIKASLPLIEAFEAARTILEREAGDDFKTVDCYIRLSEELTGKALEDGFAVAADKPLSFCVSPHVAWTSGDTSSAVLLRCRVSLGRMGRHQRTVGQDAGLKYIPVNLEAVMPSFLISFE